jgi:hypothetical protein
MAQFILFGQKLVAARPPPKIEVGHPPSGSSSMVLALLMKQEGAREKLKSFPRKMNHQ